MSAMEMNKTSQRPLSTFVDLTGKTFAYCAYKCKVWSSTEESISYAWFYNGSASSQGLGINHEGSYSLMLAYAVIEF